MRDLTYDRELVKKRLEKKKAPRPAGYKPSILWLCATTVAHVLGKSEVLVLDLSFKWD